MKIGFASDHAGYQYKQALIAYLRRKGYSVVDYGTHGTASVDYPDFAHALAKGIEKGEVDLGIALCGTGNGMAMSLNHHPAIRAGLESDVKRFIAGGKYELLMEAIDSGEIMRMYSIGDEKTVNSFAMFAIDGEETTFICLDGQMDREQLEKVLAEEMKK